MQLTYLDSNSWFIEMAGLRILLDPWLVDSLVFGNLPWLFKGDRTHPKPIPEAIDYILLSQGLEDHAHPPTLKTLDSAIPVVTSPNGAKVVEKLHYQTITSLGHGDSVVLQERLKITALKGSPVGPTLIENGYLLEDLTQGETLYYEPHGYHWGLPKTLKSVDVALIPLVDLRIPLLGPVIKGQATAIALCEKIQPRYAIATAAGGDITFTGVLNQILRQQGTVADFQQQLSDRHLSTQAIDPKPGQPFELSWGSGVPAKS